ncbi:cadherin-like and PC-esterase domain-containing protein 1 isoform X2 [Conger conger]|uniref:cadherin-like and PC-esterase domain-containing protein 1 isoform X2 n=1 Tax=Conger conger TaxID=82655 RepID=UPI002A5AA13D|nr:cadherin-like and PC-esterase domain-containing protein 1 isoform X2 [Conger conger]
MVFLLPRVFKAEGEAGMFRWLLRALRRRCCPRSVLLVGVALCLFYQTLVVARSRLKASPTVSNLPNKSLEPDGQFGQLLRKHPDRLNSVIGGLKNESTNVQLSQSGRGRRAVVLIGQRVSTDTEVQLYLRVLQQRGYEVRASRCTDASAALPPGGGEWEVLVCLPGPGRGCSSRVESLPLRPHQRVNLIPGLARAFSPLGGVCRFQSDSRLSGLEFPIIPSACAQLRATNGPGTSQWAPPHPPLGTVAGHGFVAMVKVYVLVTSATPLTAFFHPTCLVRTDLSSNGYVSKLQPFLLKQLGADAPLALGNTREAVGGVLLAAAATVAEPHPRSRCLLCFQLLTFTLLFNGSLLPQIVQVQEDLRFEEPADPDFEGQIAKELVLEDSLNFLLPATTGNQDLTKLFSDSDTPVGESYGGCLGTHRACLPPNETLLLLQFAQQLKAGGPFKLLYPASSPGLDALQHRLSQRFRTAGDSGTGVRLAALLNWVLNQTGMGDPEGQAGRKPADDSLHSQNSQLEKHYSQWSDCGHDRCVDPHLRQVYTDPPLVLSPPFSPEVKEYQAEVPFDTVMMRIRAEPLDCGCQVHLDERRGPRMANYPVGLGSSRVSVLLTDESGAEPVIVAVYTLSLYRQPRPSLPMFHEHVTCGFEQDCGLLVQPGRPCGLEPLVGTPSPGEPQAYDRACSSGDAPGRWVVPCLSCYDNRTCDWREVSWQPYDCHHPALTRPQLQTCLTDRKVLFIGDSTNRGMMYYLMERVNATLEAWGKAHDTIVYHNVNQGATLIRYSYYPQFWLEKARRPTFKRALEQLIERSRPLEDSAQTVLVAGGVQWLNTNHLTILHQVLKRENLLNILVVVKSLGMGFHLPVDGIRSLSLRGVQDLYHTNEKILTAAKHHGYEVVDTFRITMGRYKEFLQGRCACHFHEVGKATFSEASPHRKMKLFGQSEPSPAALQEPGASSSPYHVKGPINQVYSEILLSRLCWGRTNLTMGSH